MNSTISFPYLNTHFWHIFHDQAHTALNTLDALAYEDALVRFIASANSPLHPHSTMHQVKSLGALHVYSSQQPTVILGAKDTRLPQLSKGLEFLKSEGYDVVLRSHGGLAVVSDPGILNLSMITDTRAFPLTIDTAYEQMIMLLYLLVKPYGHQVYAEEIEDSYCPGKFDIVVQHQKIGGIAQRRFKTGVATSAYVSVDGNQQHRAQLIKTFYNISKADDTYPNVNPDVMTTLSDLYQQPYTKAQLYADLLQQFNHISDTQIGHYDNSHLTVLFQKAFEQTKTRTQQLFMC